LWIPPMSKSIWTLEILGASLSGCSLIIAFILNPNLPVLPGAPWIGRISYSIYLVHGIFLDFRSIGYSVTLWLQQRPRLHFLLSFLSGEFGLSAIVFFAMVILFAAFSFYCIEKPGIAAGKRAAALISRRWK